MTKAVLIQNPTSIYADEVGVSYDFPASYLKRMQQTVGDWVILYEGRSGAFGYVGVQKIDRIIPKPGVAGRWLALVEPGSLLEFERHVPRNDPAGRAYEPMLRGPEGKAMSGGRNTEAVRLIDALSFSLIVGAGLAEGDPTPNSLPRSPSSSLTQALAPISDASGPAFFDPAMPFSTDRLRILSDRAFRDAAFARMVKRAYDGRCAISGLALRNGGGRPEVEAAHIVPVKDGGHDIVANGLALSGTLHWMFDRGLIAVADDMRVLVSHNKVPADVVRRLLDPGQALILPRDPRHQPHPALLRWHRENIFGKGDPLPN